MLGQDNPFADLIPASPQQPPAPARIYGAPKRVDPAEQQRLDLAERAAARSDEANARANATAERVARTAENQTTKLTENESKTTNFYNSARQSENEWKSLEANPETAPGTQPVGALGDLARAVLPTNIVNSNTSAARQRAQQAKDNFIRASLRLESGAAIGKEEFDRQDRIFYPQTGDTPENLAQKARARQAVIEGFRIGSGNGAEKVDQLRSGDPKQTNVSENGLSAIAGAFSGPVAPDAIQEDGRINRGGQIIDPGDDVTNSPAFQDAYEKKFGKPLGLVVSVTGGQQSPEAAQRDTFLGATDAAVRGAADIFSGGLSDEISAAGDTLFSGGTMAGNLAKQRGIDQMDERLNPLARLGGQLAGGLVLPTGGARTAAELGRVGAGYGAAYGFGSTDGDFGQRMLGGGVGAATGGAAGYGLGALGNVAAARLGGRTPPGGGGPTAAQDLQAAAGRQGYPLTVPDIAPGSRGVYSMLESVPIAGGAVRNDLQPGVQRIEQRVGDIGGAEDVGRAQLGANVQAGINRYSDRSRTVVNRAYDRAARLSEGQTIAPRQAVANIDQQIADLGRTPEANAAPLQILNRLRADMADQGGARALDVDSINNLRTAMRTELNQQGLRFSDTERRVNQVLDAAGQDIAAQLTGPALRAQQRAQRLHAERVNFVDDVARRFLGGRGTGAMSAEKTVGVIESMSNPKGGDHVRLGRMFGSLNPQEQAEVGGTIASTLGRRADDGENAFSPALFFSQIQKFTPEARAVIWGRQGAADLADLARLAEARGQVMQRMNNSGSGRVSNWFLTMRDLFAGGGAGAAAGAVSGAGAGAGVGAVGGLLTASYVTAKVLGSRHLVALLGQASRARDPAIQASVVRRLGQLATREPEIANDILPIRDALQRAISGSAARDEPPAGQVQDRRREPVHQE
ncbi:MAG: hypothetical protein JWR85_3595 [Marmoricola sp.]|nr:hypothetical protein [Marmoricola sp.]